MKVIIIILYLFTCLLNNTKANYKIRVNDDGNKQIHAHKDKRQNKATRIIYTIINRASHYAARKEYTYIHSR
jgi:hypothetical protein